MTTPINYDLEKHLLAGCKIVLSDSLNYKTTEGDYTHALIECPKEYPASLSRDRFVCFISLEVYDGKWVTMTEHYSNKRHAIKRYYENITEQRISKIRMEENQTH